MLFVQIFTYEQASKDTIDVIKTQRGFIIRMNNVKTDPIFNLIRAKSVNNLLKNTFGIKPNKGIHIYL